MYRELRRQDRKMEAAEAEGLLREADFGFLGVADAGGQPYVVPLNHAYLDGYIVFHCAKEGHKLDAIRDNPLVSYAVCTEHEVQPERYTTKYRSAVAFGRAEIVEAPGLKNALLVALQQRFAPGVRFPCSDEDTANTCVVRIKVDRVTGKKRD